MPLSAHDCAAVDLSASDALQIIEAVDKSAASPVDKSAGSPMPAELATETEMRILSYDAGRASSGSVGVAAPQAPAL
jgi:hypothetical protein